VQSLAHEVVTLGVELIKFTRQYSFCCAVLSMPEEAMPKRTLSHCLAWQFVLALHEWLPDVLEQVAGHVLREGSNAMQLVPNPATQLQEIVPMP